MLKTDYKNDVLDTSKNTKRKYQQTTNSDGTISLDDVTVYSQEGSLLGANDINATNEEVNHITEILPTLGTVRYNNDTHYIQIKIGDEWVDYRFFIPQPRALVPIMSSDTNEVGNCVGTQNASNNHLRYMAFNNSQSTYWESGANVGTGDNGGYVGFEWTNGDKYVATQIEFNCQQANRPSSFRVDALTDFGNWITLAEITNVPNTSATLVYNFDNTTAYKGYRFKPLSSHSSSWCSANKVQFYGI